MPTSLNNIESKSKAFFQAARKQQTEIIEHRSVSLRQLEHRRWYCGAFRSRRFLGPLQSKFLTTPMSTCVTLALTIGIWRS